LLQRSLPLAVADWIILAILLFNTLMAARRGIFVEAFSLGGIVVGVGVASWNYTRLLPWVQPWFHRWTDAPAIADAVSFLAIVAAVVIAAAILGRIVRWSVRSIGLGWADRFLGAMFGLLKGTVVVTLGVMLVVAFWPGSRALHGSRLAPYFVAIARSSTVGSPSELREKVSYGAKLLSEHLPASLDWEHSH
jgi:membrane protein required for colicin V production